jgi:hypothetical protein
MEFFMAGRTNYGKIDFPIMLTIIVEMVALKNSWNFFVTTERTLFKFFARNEFCGFIAMFSCKFFPSMSVLRKIYLCCAGKGTKFCRIHSIFGNIKIFSTEHTCHDNTIDPSSPLAGIGTIFGMSVGTCTKFLATYLANVFHVITPNVLLNHGSTKVHFCQEEI